MRLSSSSLFPTFLVGSSSSAFLGALPAHSSGLSGVLVGLPGFLLCLPPGYRSLSSQFPVVWLVLWLPSLRPYTRPLFGLLAVPPFLLSGSRRYVLSLTLGFSIPLPVSSSWAPLSRFSSSAASSSLEYPLWLLEPVFLLLLCASSYSRLASCFCFLGCVFQALGMFRGFLSYFSGLSISRSTTCFGLELFLDFLSFRLLGFPVLFSPCGVSHLTTLSLFLSVPWFLMGWIVRPPSSSVVFRRLLLFIGLLWVGRPVLFLFSVSLFLVCSWVLCSPSFPPPRLWSSRLALSFCRRAPGLLFASGSVFLPSLPSW